MMAKQLKVATLNLCLGLKNKKDLVKELLMSNEIDILAMQEIEIFIKMEGPNKLLKLKLNGNCVGADKYFQEVF